ncbi:mitochondrial carrier domain-containing protein [Scleroderma yunnanense]
MNGLVFASYKFFTRAQLDDPAALPSLTQVAVAGACCSMVTSLIASPTELVKIRQQNVLEGGTSAAKIAINILKQNGIRGFYRGLGATALRDTGYGTYFMAYEATCRYFRPATNSTPKIDHSSILSEIDSEAQSTPWPILFLAGGLAGIAGWITTFPMDVIKTRMQSTDIVASVRNPPRRRELDPLNPYRTILSTAIHSYRSEGYRVFFKGLVPTLIRAVPVNMATFSVYEAVVLMLS